jgi:predicted ATP-dependent endonuclease of OLD family
MHLQRVQVPDFRVLKDVDITFEHNFNPRVFPLGSQNGGGKSTLLQLIFVLLHCSPNPERIIALNNLLNGFSLQDGEEKRILAIIDVWDGEKTINLEFFICADNYISTISNYVRDEESEISFSFSLFSMLDALKQEILEFENEQKRLKNIIQQFENRQSTSSHYRKFPEHLKIELSSLNIDFDSIEVDFSDPDFLGKIEKETRLQLSNKHTIIDDKAEIYSVLIDQLLKYLKLLNIEYITSYSSEDKENDNLSLLCKISGLDMDISRQFLDGLSNSIFLSAPSTQVFLFLPKNSRKSLLTNRNNYYADLERINSNLTGLITYDFLAVKTLIAAIQRAGQLDFEIARLTGEYGNNYKQLLKDLNFLLHDKQVNITPDLSGLTFTKKIAGNKVEIETEDLSHGELKRLSIYIWLKYYNIEDAIVLMDEVDLALHPDWQYQIVSDLVDWEPSNQYILATHSYELCNALTPSHVKILEPKLTERRSE